MTGLPQYQLVTPIVNALVTLLTANLNTVIDQYNASIDDNTPAVPHAVQILPYMPFMGTLEGGTPLIAVQRLGGRFLNDLQSTGDAEHRYAVVPIVENADHATLALQLDAMLQCIAYTIHQDRVAGLPAGTQSIVKAQGGAWSVDFDSYEPGPLLGDIDPDNPGLPPRSYRSWLALILRSDRREA